MAKGGDRGAGEKFAPLTATVPMHGRGGDWGYADLLTPDGGDGLGSSSTKCTKPQMIRKTNKKKSRYLPGNFPSAHLNQYKKPLQLITAVL